MGKKPLLFSLSLVICLVAFMSSGAFGEVLFDTGPPRQVIFQGGAPNFLGWTSGNPGATQPQRWTAQPFMLPSGNWDVTQLDVYYFVPTANVVTDVHWTIWSRDGQNRPVDGDILAEGSVPEFGCGGGGCPTAEDFVEIPIDVNLAGGDYYLTIYGSNAAGDFTSLGWTTNADNGINFVGGDGAFMWRSEAFPNPGFGEYNLTPDILEQLPEFDPNDLYNAAFAVHGVPEPSMLMLLAIGGVAALRRRRAQP